MRWRAQTTYQEHKVAQMPGYATGIAVADEKGGDLMRNKWI